MKKKQGIVLFAFARRGYAYMAYNLAFTIKYYNPSIDITLFIDEKIAKYLNDHEYFDNIYTLPSHYIITPKQGVDPCCVKINIYDLMPYDENIYLDVDAIAFKDLQPLINTLSNDRRNYVTQVIDIGGYNENIEYDVWAKKDYIWDFFELDKEKDKYPAVQTSFAFFRKSEEMDSFYNDLKKYYEKGFDKSKMITRWGGSLPDEMFYSAVCAKKGLNPKSEINPIYFGNGYTKDEDSFVKENFYLLAIYGNGRGRTLTKQKYLDMYDNILNKIFREKGKEHIYPTRIVMTDKHANF